MKTTFVSIPDRVFEAGETLAAHLGVSRSELYTRALAAMVEKHGEGLITSLLKDIYGPDAERAVVDPKVVSSQGGSTPLSKLLSG